MDIACAGKWELFDSTHPVDHEAARRICRTCPALDWCRQLAHQVNRAQRAYPNGGMQGTWGGRLYGASVTYTTARQRISSEEAMFTDDECRDAHAAWCRGMRDERTTIGERVYQRRQKRSGRAAA